MAYKFQVNITNGTGTANVANGTYTGTITSTTPGYTTNPALSNFTIADGQTDVALQITASGSYTLTATQDGTIPVAGATFIRCDSTGATTYGDTITTDAAGIASFSGIPWDAAQNINFYFKQTGTADGHTFDADVYTEYINALTGALAVTNPLAPERAFTLADSITGASVAAGTINITAS